MKNTLMDAIKWRTIGRQAAQRPLRSIVDVDVRDGVTKEEIDSKEVYRVSVELGFLKVLSKGEPLHMAREQAYASLIRYIYADPLEQLKHIREQIWADGMSGTETDKLVAALIDDLSGNLGEFE